MDNENNDTMVLIYIILLIVFLEAIAQSCLKKSKVSNNHSYTCISVIAYCLICILLLKTYTYRSMGIVNLIWSCFSIIAIISSGIIFFHETITLNDIIGILLIFAGLYFVFMKDHVKNTLE